MVIILIYVQYIHICVFIINNLHDFNFLIDTGLMLGENSGLTLQVNWPLSTFLILFFHIHPVDDIYCL